MNDLIKREELLDYLRIIPIDLGYREMEDVVTFVEKMKSVDAVEVVRCGECKHWVRDGNESYGYAMFCKADCSLGGQGRKKPDDFCSYGERKADG